MSYPHANAERSGRSAPGGSPGLRALAFGLVLLGVCVFAWGLKYKLSLYDPPHAVSHHMPEAKLVSGRDRAALAVVSVPRMVHPGPAFELSVAAVVFLVLLGAQLWPGDLRWFPGLLHARLRPQWIYRQALFVRPPPSRL